MAHPDNLLFRSRIEILRLMQALAHGKCRITATLAGSHPFSSFLVAFDAASERFAIDYSPHKSLNAMLLAASSVEFTAIDQNNLNYTFIVSGAEEAMIAGGPAIRFPLPKAILMHNRREHPRLPTPADLSLRCVADEAGVIPFESHVTDLSHDGLGCLVYDPDVRLEPGMVLHGCRIVIPGGDAVVVDMELRHVAPQRLPDGTLAQRAGFRLLKKNGELAKLLRLFIQDMDKK
jgi:c-di-GMP-binding flagellar brake protein YcgR